MATYIYTSTYLTLDTLLDIKYLIGFTLINLISVVHHLALSQLTL